MIKRRKQSGTAIIVALFVTALVAAASVAMIDYLRIDTRRTELLLNNMQATQLAEGAIDFALDQLRNNFKAQEANKLADKLPMHLPVSTMSGMTIRSTIYDAQSKLNLNSLSDPLIPPMFERLIHTVSPGTSAEDAKKISHATLLWISKGANSNDYDAYYGGLNPPYRTAHQPMISVSELRLVKGVSPELFNKLAPYITALPEETAINLNTAPIPLLMAMNPGMNLDTAKEIAALRIAHPITSTDSLSKIAVVKSSPFAQNTITTTSEYFLVATHVTKEDQDTVIYTMIHRIPKNPEPGMVVVWQSTGTL